MQENLATHRSRDKEQIVPPDYTAPFGPEDDEGFVPIYPDETEEIEGPNPDISGSRPHKAPPGAKGSDQGWGRS